MARATHKSDGLPPSGLRIWVSLCLASCLLAGAASGAEGEFAAFARHVFTEAEARYARDPGNPEAAWQMARAEFDLAEFSTNNAQRAALAQQSIAACRKALEQAPQSVPVRYYLAMNLGQLARTKSLGALKLVDQMEREFAFAREHDPHFDYAGPDRNLGLLYRDAPLIGSIGSRSKARQHLQRAVELEPDYPENRLNWVESCLKWSDRAEARRQIQILETQWAAARKVFAGPAWASSWADWEQRLGKFRKKAGDSAKALESPRRKE